MTLLLSAVAAAQASPETRETPDTQASPETPETPETPAAPEDGESTDVPATEVPGALGAPQAPLEGTASVSELHGFISQGFIKTTRNDYLARSMRGSFEFAEAAVNLAHPLGESLRAGVQLFARDLGPLGDYGAKFDWFYLDWRRFDTLGLRAGRVKLPHGLYNELSDYDPGRLTILLPQSIYPITAREFLLAVTGFQLYGYGDVGSAGALEYSAMAGTLFIDPEDLSPETREAEVPYTFAARLIWETPLAPLRAGASVLVLRLDAKVDLAGTLVDAEVPAVLWVTSLEWAGDRLRLTGEYSRWHTRIDSGNPALLPSGSTVSERGYVALAWTFRDDIQGGVYYSVLFRDVDDRSGREAYQHDVAASFRCDVTPQWLFKLEAHYLNGTAALNERLNGRPAAELDEQWGLVLAKTTVYF